MNCQELQQDIANYRTQLEHNQLLLDQINQTGKKSASHNESLDQTQNMSDELLTKYLTEIYDAYPELNEYTSGEYGEQIDGFESEIKSVLRLSDRQVLVCGRYGETKILTIDDDGQASYSEQIDGFRESILSTLRLSDRQVLVCGWHGETKILTIDGNDQASYGKRIDGFKNAIKSTLRLSDRQVLVCGWDGETKILNLSHSEPSLDHLKQHMDEIANE